MLIGCVENDDLLGRGRSDRTTRRLSVTPLTAAAVVPGPVVAPGDQSMIEGE